MFSRLLVGCGKRKELLFTFATKEPREERLTTLDINEDVEPDVVHDLEIVPYPFNDQEFDEIHAYDVLEHCGRQGNYKLFFNQFNEFGRILKIGGFMFITYPPASCKWAWADPGHSRVFTLNTFSFLDKSIYIECETTPRTDYSSLLKVSFKVISHNEITMDKDLVILQRVE